MSQAVFRLILHRWLLLSVMVAGSTPWLIGCGESDTGPVTARSSQYQAADQDSGDESVDSATADTTDPQPAPTGREPAPSQGGAEVRMTDIPDSPGEIASDPAPATSETQSPATSPAATAGQPPAPPAFDSANNLDLNNLDPNNLPDDEAKLLTLLEVLQVRQPRGRTEQEQIEDYFRIQSLRVRAAEKLWDLAGGKETRISAVQTKLDAMRAMSRFGAPDVEKQLNAYCHNLQKNEDPDIAYYGRLMLFGLAVDDLAMGAEVDQQKLLEELKNLAAETPKNPGTLTVVSQAADVFLRLGKRDIAIDAYRAIGESFRGCDDKAMATEADLMLERVRILEAGMDTSLQAVAEGKADSETPLLATIDSLLAAEGSGMGTLAEVGGAAAIMEMTDHYELAGKIYEKIASAYKDSPNTELATQAVSVSENGLKHVDLIGAPFEMTGVNLDGSPFDWTAYKGKVVLVSFWTLSEDCLREISNMIGAYRQYRDQGFDVVGVNLDQDIKTVQRIMDIQPLPWTIVISADPEQQGSKNPLAVRCGVDPNVLPFAILVGRDGKVSAVHARGPRLYQKLQEIFGPPAESLPGAAPGSGAPAQPPVQTPAPAGGPAPTNDQSLDSAGSPETFFVSFQQSPADDSADDGAEEIEQINPYSPHKDLDANDLVDFILDMQDKPKSIQQRPGFGAALIEASDRILAAETTDKYRRIAAETKFDVLHGKACLGDEKADAALVAFVDQMKDSQDEKIAEHVRFFQHERKAIGADDLPLEEIPELLAELKQYLADRTLDDRYLRLASSTVHAVNRLEDVDKREEYFQEFGALFTKADSKELSRYGKKLAKKPGLEMPDLVGNPLELAGVTALGTAFDWSSYRGKVVLVDFWATWCGPCRAAMPQVKALYEELHEKGFDIVGVSLDKDQEKMAEYLEENTIVWTNLIGDEASALAKQYGIRGIPTMILVDREGVVVAASHKLDTLKPLLDKLLKKTEQ